MGMRYAVDPNLQDGQVYVSFVCHVRFFQAGKGGELTHDETTIIAGALELSEKMVKDAMTPISDIFVIDINAKLDRFLCCGSSHHMRDTLAWSLYSSHAKIFFSFPLI